MADDGFGIASFDSPAQTSRPGRYVLQDDDRQAIASTSQRLGISPADLTTVIDYETGGTMSPAIRGGKNNQHIGLIQFGANEQKQYGAHQGQTFSEQLQSAERYLVDRGLPKGADISTLYRTINGGNPRADLGASDGNGTIAQHVERMRSRQPQSIPGQSRRVDNDDGFSLASFGDEPAIEGGDIETQPARRRYVGFEDFTKQVKAVPQFANLTDGQIANQWISTYGDMTPPAPPGLWDRAKQGFRNTLDAFRVSMSSDPTGQEAAQIIAAGERDRLDPTAAQISMAQDIKPYQSAYDEAKGPAAAGAFAMLAAKRIQQFVLNPKEALGMMVENLPNSAPGMAAVLGGSAAGAAVGTSVAGPPGTAVGSAIGGVVGGAAGGYPVEQGSSFIEQVVKGATEANINLGDTKALAGYIQDNYAEILRKSRLKGIGTSASDAVLTRLTLGIGGAGQRALRTEIDALAKAAGEGSVSLKQFNTIMGTLEARNAARNTLGARAARGAGMTGAEMLGEGASEAIGQKLGYGQVDALDVIDEALLGFGQGAAMSASRGVLDKAMGVGAVSDVEASLTGARAAGDALSVRGDAIAAAGAQRIDQAQTVEEVIAGAAQIAAAPVVPGDVSRAIADGMDVISPIVAEQRATDAAISKLDAFGSKAESVATAAKDAEYDALQRESQFPKAMFDARQVEAQGAQDDVHARNKAARLAEMARASGANEFAAAPTAMQLALERARGGGAAEVVPTAGNPADSADRLPATGEQAGTATTDQKKQAIDYKVYSPQESGKTAPLITAQQATLPGVGKTSSEEFIRAVEKLGGVNKGLAMDIAGDKGVKGLGPAYRRVFRARKQTSGGRVIAGHGVDDLAVMLVERGWLPRAELESVDGGSQRVRDMLREALNGTLGPVTDAQIARARDAAGANAQAREAGDREAEIDAALDQAARGIGAEVYDGLSVEERAEYDEFVDRLEAEIGPAKLAALKERAAIQTETEDAYYTQLVRLINRQLDVDRTGQSTEQALPENAQAGDRGRVAEAGAEGDGLKLEGQTRQDLTAEAETARAADVAQREDRAAADRERDAYQLQPSAGAVTQRSETAAVNQQNLFGEVDQAAHAAATSPRNDLAAPTEAQKEAGNYTKGHVDIGPLDITIENPAGSKRRPEWPTLQSHYGYLKLTEGADGDHVDIFVKPGTRVDYNGPVYVVNQNHVDGKFDESKVMLGWSTEAAAREAYLENYTKGWDRIRSIAAFPTVDAFDAWLKNEDTTKPAPVVNSVIGESEEIISGVGDDLVTLYHGTSKENATAIGKSGVIKSGNYFGGIDGVALTPRKDMAHEYAGDDGVVIEVKIPKEKLVVDPESRDNDDIDAALRDGASVYAVGDVKTKLAPAEAKTTTPTERDAIAEALNNVAEAIKGIKEPAAKPAAQAERKANPDEPESDTRFSRNVEDYGIAHRPPDSENGAPLHDLSGTTEDGRGIYPEDIYGPNGAQYYGHYGQNNRVDVQSVGIMRSVRGKPNATVTIYRAVPDVVTNAERIEKLEAQKRRYMARGEVPEGESKNGWYDRASNEIDRLRALPAETDTEAIAINPGDWVTINRDYAKEHGESSLEGEYRIISKKVKAKELFTDGNSVHEFGYWPDGTEGKEGNPKTMMSRGRAPTRGLSKYAVQGVVDRLKNNYANAPEIVVLEKADDAPPSLRQQIMRKGAQDDIEGAYHNGKVYVFSRNLESETRAEYVIFTHELRHYGLRGIMGQELSRVLGQIYLANPKIRVQADRLMKENGIGRVEATEEAMADTKLDDLMKLRGASKLLQVIRDWLKARGMENLAGHADTLLRAMAGNQRVEDAFLGDILRASEAWVKFGSPAGSEMFMGGTRFADVYHGTPHDFDRFDMSKIGTGEGAQAYGHGLYFAQNEGVAKGYQKDLGRLRTDTAEIIESIMPERHFTTKERAEVYKSATGDDPIEKAAERLGYRQASLREVDGEKLTAIIAETRRQASGALYKVDIPDEAVARMLDWDRPLSEQIPSVQAALKKIGITSGINGNSIYGKASLMPDGITENPVVGSKKLAAAGIPGIKYLDQGSRNRPLKDIKREFLSELPEDASADEVRELFGTGSFSPKNEALLKALDADEWLGFDYPAQAVSAALNPRDLANMDPSPELRKAVAEAQEGGTRNIVLFDDKLARITHKNGTLVSAAERREAVADAMGGDDDGARFSRRGIAGTYDTLKSSNAQNGRLDTLRELFDDARTFNVWNRTIGTQFHKAKKDPRYFGPVFNAVNKQINDTARFALESEAEAPSILQRMDGTKDVWRTLIQGGAKAQADLKAAGRAIFDNIEGLTGVKQKVFTDKELRDGYNLTDRQIQVYREFREAVDTSLDRLAQTTMMKAASPWMNTKDMLTMTMPETAAEIDAGLALRQDQIRDRLSGLDDERRSAKANRQKSVTISEEMGGIDESKNQRVTSIKDKVPTQEGLEKQIADIQDVRDRIDGMAELTADLKEKGYSPAMRFGRYAVTVKDGDNVEFFSMYETQTEANIAAMRLRQEYPTYKVEKSTMNPDLFRMFGGVSPETAELFARFMGAEDSDAFKAYLSLAKSSRSAMQRMNERKGVAGFSWDPQRVLAQFVMSNARQGAMNINSSDINKALSDIPKELGQTQNEAQKLVEYVRDPQEENAAMRGLLFMHFIGGSIASAMTNLTQPVMMTTPYLHQFAGNRVAKIMADSMKMAVTGKIPDAGLRNALNQADEEGITRPHETYMLMADATGGALGSNPRWNAFKKTWGGLFSLSEALNRKITFLAAYQTAQKMGADKLSDAGFDNAYDFAKDAVVETQGLYNKANRPNWARGPVGATLFTFKQFSVAYVEFFMRLPRKQQALALGLLLLAAGAEGLPFAEDVEDLVDTLGQKMGYATNSKRAIKQALASVLGDGLSEFALHGASAIPGMPLDVSARMGLSNLIPGTAILNPSRKDKSNEVLEVFGAAGGLAKSIMSASDTGKAGEAMPSAIRNAMKGMQMANTGEYRDAKGRKVTDADALDAMVKFIGFQPSHIAADTRQITAARRDVDIVKHVESEIAEDMATAIIERDGEKAKEARQRLADWNSDNKDFPIRITMAQITRRVKEAKMTRDQRFLKTAPPEVRGRLLSEIAQ